KTLLQQNEGYDVRVAAGVSDMARNVLETAVVRSFVTGDEPDFVGPRLSASNPTDEQAGISTSPLLVLTFDERLDETTTDNMVDLYNYTSGGYLPVSTSLSVDGTILTVSPVNVLPESTRFRLRVLGGRGADVSGNTSGWSYIDFTTTAGALGGN
ncbi:Ig-like domain-containing protein, partial [Parvularcula maris]